MFVVDRYLITIDQNTLQFSIYRRDGDVKKKFILTFEFT